jgi:hypothetical protein
VEFQLRLVPSLPSIAFARPFGRKLSIRHKPRDLGELGLKLRDEGRGALERFWCLIAQHQISLDEEISDVIQVQAARRKAPPPMRFAVCQAVTAGIIGELATYAEARPRIIS